MTRTFSPTGKMLVLSNGWAWKALVPPRNGSITSPMVPGPTRPVTLPILPVRLRSALLCIRRLRGSFGPVLAVFERRGQARKERAGLREDPADHAVEAVAAVQHRHLADVAKWLGRSGHDGR